MRKTIAPLALAAVTFAMLASPAAAGNKTVSWGYSSRGTITINRGNTVDWIWRSGPHNVVGPGFRSGGATSRGHYRRKFTKRGSFTVYCAPHSSLMRMTVKVR